MVFVPSSRQVLSGNTHVPLVREPCREIAIPFIALSGNACLCISIDETFSKSTRNLKRELITSAKSTMGPALCLRTDSSVTD